MIKYDPHAWARHLVTVRGSVLPRLVGRLLFVAVWSCAIAWLHRRHGFAALPGTPHGFVGLALGLLLVFRTNSAYDRFWEGRKRWGSIVNHTRDLSRQVLAWVDDMPELKARIVKQIVAFAHVTRRHLRGERDLAEVRALLGEADLATVEAAQHQPLAVTEAITLGLHEARAAEKLSDFDAMTLDLNIRQLIDDLGACERILKTPMPFAYVMHLRRFLTLWCLTVPFVLVAEGWVMPIEVVVITYALLGIEEIGVQIEDPFGHDYNDLPLDEITEGIEKSCLELLDRVEARA